MDIDKTIWVTQRDYDSGVEQEINLSVIDEGIEIDLVGGVGTIIIQRDQFGELCNLLFNEIAWRGSDG